MRCPQCNALLDDNARFCPKCGASLEGTSRSQAMQKRATGQQQGASPNAAHARSEARNQKKATAQKRKSRYRFIALVLGVAVILVAGFLLWDVHMRPYNLNAKDFPSEGVRAAAAAVDTDGNGAISREEAEAVESLTITEGDEIYGFGMFPNLVELVIDSNEVRKVDVSTAASLQSLKANGASSLGEVVFKGNTQLTTLDLSGTDVVSIDLSGASNLKAIEAANSALASIDISHLGQLASLNVTNTDIESIDVAGLSSLSILRCDSDVQVENLSDTSLVRYWEVSSFQNNVPPFGSVARQRLQMTAQYDNANRLVGATVEDAGAALTEPAVIAYEYNENGKVVRATFSALKDDAGDAIDCVWELVYNDKGDLVQAYNDAGCSCTYDYDSDHRLKTYTMTLPSGKIERYSFTYDQTGHLVSAQHNASEAIMYSYDEQGLLTDATTVATSSGASTSPSQGTSQVPESSGSSSEDRSEGASSSSSSSGGSASPESAASGDAGSRSSSSTFAAAEIVSTYAYTYDSEGRCVRCDYTATNENLGSYVETYTYASDGTLLDAQRTSRAITGGTNDYVHDISSSKYEYANDGSLASCSLTRANQSEGIHETYALRYQCVYAVPSFAPVGTIWQGGYPLASMVDDGIALSEAVLSGQSQFTPWARLPQVHDIVFNRQVALFDGPLA